MHNTNLLRCPYTYAIVTHLVRLLVAQSLMSTHPHQRPLTYLFNLASHEDIACLYVPLISHAAPSIIVLGSSIVVQHSPIQFPPTSPNGNKKSDNPNRLPLLYLGDCLLNGFMLPSFQKIFLSLVTITIGLLHRFAKTCGAFFLLIINLQGQLYHHTISLIKRVYPKLLGCTPLFFWGVPHLSIQQSINQASILQSLNLCCQIRNFFPLRLKFYILYLILIFKPQFIILCIF